jgi:L-alanine-DL-glutamate epimerase-like enolase superfamily enzyme
VPRHSNTRRDFLKASAGAGLLGAAGALGAAPARAAAQDAAAQDPALPAWDALPRPRLERASPRPVTIRSIEVLRLEGHAVLRTTSTDGVAGHCVTNGRDYLLPLLKDRVIPFFLGKDARDLGRLVDEVYRSHESNYKLAGLAFWNCVGWVDVSVMDLLGRVAGRPIAALLGGARRAAVPIYVSSIARDTSPEQEVERLQRGMAATGATGVKFKVGGRMSSNQDAAPGRSERLVPLARKALGDRATLYADANGSYDVRRGVEVGRLLEAHGVDTFEEPVPFDEYEHTKQVADALRTVKVAGGEQDTSLARWRHSIIGPRAVDVVQPDILYNGGFYRTWMVAQLAHAAGLGVAPHNPKVGAEEAHLLQFAAAVPNLSGLQEYHIDARPSRGWYAPEIVVKDGMLAVPTGPGLGIEIDPAAIRRAERLV